MVPRRGRPTALCGPVFMLLHTITTSPMQKLFLPATDANAGFETLEAEQAAADSERKTVFLRFLGSLDEAGAPAKSHAGSAAPTPAQGGHKRGREGGAPGGHSGGALAAPFLGRREAEAAGGPGAGFSHAYAAVEGSPQFHPVHAPPPAHYPHAYALPHSAHELQHSTGHNAYPTTAPAPRAAPRVALPHPGSMPPPPVCVGPSHMYGMGPGHTGDEAYHMRQDPMLRHRPPPVAHHYYEPPHYDHLPAGTGNPPFHDHDAAAAGYPPPLGSIHLTPGVARALAQQLLPVLREDPRGMQGRDGVLAQDLARAVAQSEGRGHPAQGGWVGGPGAWATVPRQVPTLDLGRLVRQAYAPAPDTPSEVDRRAAPAAAQGGDKRRRMGSAVGDAAEALHALAQANPDTAHQGKASVYGVPPSE